VVATGDFFVPMLGVCDLPNGCDWRRFVAGVRRLLEVVPKNAKLAPGHGPLSSYADLKDFAEMLSEVTDFVQKQIKAGKKLEEIKAQGLPARWRSWAERGISADFFLTNVYDGLAASVTQADR
jgi:glyoxylase-like metal-dependent hydrolase (beta-lactamase superfamily II)